MTAHAFRKMALKVAEAREGEHMGHADFRLGGKIFATVGYPDEAHGMVKLTPEQQKAFMEKAPDVFGPCAGAWGKAGSTFVKLDRVADTMLREAIKAAAANRASEPRKSQRPPRGGRL
jgi:hypothetical protein